MALDKEHLKRLVILAKNGDKDAFQELYESCYTPLFRYIFARVKNRHTAEDLTQNVFIKIWNHLPKWDEAHSSPLSFFFKVAHNSMIDHYRKRSNNEIISDEIVNDFINEQSSNNNEKKLDESREIINQIVTNLTKEQQEIITLIYTNDLSYEEISKIIDKKEDTIRQIHSRAIKKLRSLYKV